MFSRTTDQTVKDFCTFMAKLHSSPSSSASLERIFIVNSTFCEHLATFGPNYVTDWALKSFFKTCKKFQISKQKQINIFRKRN